MFDELFGGLDKKYARKFNWVDIRDDQGPSLAALDSVLDKRHPLYYAKRAAALARREPGGDVLFLMEDGSYVIVNPSNPSYDALGLLTYREFTDFQNVIHSIHEGYAEEHIVDAQLDSDQELADILEETRDQKAYSKFWHLYHVVMVAVHSLLLSILGFFLNGLIMLNVEPMVHFVVPFMGEGDWKQEPIAWVSINFVTYALLRLVDFIVKKRTGFMLFDSKAAIKAIALIAAALMIVTAMISIPISDVSENLDGYYTFYLYLMPLYMGLIVHGVGIYLFYNWGWLRDKMEF